MRALFVIRSSYEPAHRLRIASYERRITGFHRFFFGAVASRMARSAKTLARCWRYSADAKLSLSASIPSAACSQAELMSFSDFPRSAFSTAVALYAWSATPVMPIEALSIRLPLARTTAATPTTAKPDAGWWNLQYAVPEPVVGDTRISVMSSPSFSAVLHYTVKNSVDLLVR